jgi:DNA repair protein RecN (Recombination protein N)
VPSLASLAAAEAAARAERDRINGVLSVERGKAALELETQLMEALRPMGLANVRFEVAIEPAEPGEEGADAVVFLFSANPGQPLAPLAEVASGGEMSRFLLALKTCLAVADPHVTLLFDEIDTGVSGRVSGAMAELLRQLATRRQVFCVTHQPLLAAAADHHFRVSKQVEDGVTHTRVSQLRDTARAPVGTGGTGRLGIPARPGPMRRVCCRQTVELFMEGQSACSRLPPPGFAATRH